MKKLFKLSGLLLFLLITTSLSGASLKDYHYTTVPNDPLKARIYTLDNGLKVYMTVNKEQPRIQTYIAVRVGGKNDPAETTGLAHYFEHLMFKGTEKFGTQNYEMEKPLLDQIEQEFEIYRKTTDSLSRKAIYHTIDSLSYQASKYAIPNEYDKLMAAIGAKGTNAYTSFDVTCFTEDIPSNEVDNWANMLMRMYLRYAETNGYKVSIANLQEGDEAGIKACTIEIAGDYAYGYLKGENGVHRLVRVSPYNAQGKRMTSFASVFVTPLVDDTIEVNISAANVSWDTFRSSGAGGQNVNKVESGVRLRYQFKDPYTGEEEEILVENTETRDQPKNRDNAMRQLRSILYDKELKHRMAEQAKVEAGKKKIEWGSQIRSYVFDDRRVKDHRTNYQTSDVNGVMDGKIEGFIKAYLMEFAEGEE